MSVIAAQPAREEVKGKAENEWTIMVFFAGDPHLSPSMTSQLKALKDAGFQENTTVLVHYDPNERGAATTTFEINRMRKQQMRELNKTPTVIGDGKDPFVRNLVEDSIPGGAPRSATALEALKQFLRLGIVNHPAKHYMLFLVGHGMIVGNDAFLPDDEPDSAIALKELGKTMRAFSQGVQMVDGTLELIGLHSCSMSAIEVFYELRGAARYMMGTEGISYVSSWPYRQVLKKLLNTVDNGNGKNVDVDDLIESIQSLALHNSTDFMFSGLSADLSLCRLDAGDKTMAALNDSIRYLTRALKAGLEAPRSRDLILLAHLEAQSYWNETYTDLYDFCLCLARRCDGRDSVENKMAEACDEVMVQLKESGSIIAQSDYFGPLYQYSHGLSVYFPWSQPIHDHAAAPEEDILKRYEEYQFTKELGEDSWFSFLQEYFKATRRPSRHIEGQQGKVQTQRAVAGNGTRASVSPVMVVAGVTGTATVSAESLQKASPALDDNRKASPPLGNGACSCSVKNYPMEFSRSRDEDPNKPVIVKQLSEYYDQAQAQG